MTGFDPKRDVLQFLDGMCDESLPLATIDAYEVVRDIIKSSRSNAPNSSHCYMRITDEELSKHLPADMVGKSQSQPANSLSNIEGALADVPAFTQEQINFDVSNFCVVTCPATIELVCEGFIQNYDDYFTLAVRAGVDFNEAKGISSAFKNGDGILISTKLSDKIICDNDSNLKFHEHASTTRFDKVDTRKLAEGYFPQPAYLDSRYISNPSGIRFEVFSPNEVYGAIPSEFFDEKYKVGVLRTEAFALFRFGDKFFCQALQINNFPEDERLTFPIPITAEQKLMKSILGSVLGLPSNIKELFQYYEKKGVRFVNEIREDIEQQERPSVSKLLLSLKEPVYIKGSLSSGGKMVVRLSQDENGAPVLESSSPDFALLFEDTLYTSDERLQKTQDVEITEKRREAHKVCVEQLLSRVISEIKQPIIEAEIPFETRNGNRVEFRIICQKLSPELDPSVVAHYCKESPDPVAANISIAGDGSFTIKVIKDLVAKRHSDLSAKEKLVMTNKYLAEIIEAVNNFIPTYSDRRNIYDFAVDLVPVWNEVKNSLEFWLLEVQTPYGFSGLESIDPTLAQEVRERKNRG